MRSIIQVQVSCGGCIGANLGFRGRGAKNEAGKEHGERGGNPQERGSKVMKCKQRKHYQDTLRSVNKQALCLAVSAPTGLSSCWDHLGEWTPEELSSTN